MYKPTTIGEAVGNGTIAELKRRLYVQPAPTSRERLKIEAIQRRNKRADEKKARLN